MSNREEFGAALENLNSRWDEFAMVELPSSVAYIEEASARVMALWDEREAALKQREEDAERLDWLMLNLSGVELRRLNVMTTANCDRASIDLARQAQKGEPPAIPEAAS